MERDCMKGMENIYLRCRREAGIHNEKLRSREGAAEMLGCSLSTLANYELGVTKVVPPDAVIMMADLYNAPELKAHYCARDCPIGKGTPIATEIKSIEIVTVNLLKALSPSSVENVKSKLLDIAAGGINKNKKQDLADLLRFLDDLTKILGELRLLSQKHLAGGVDSEISD